MSIFFLYIFCAVITLLFSVLVLFSNYKSRIHQLFFVFGTFIFIWIACIYTAIHFRKEEIFELHIFFARLTFGLSAIIPYLFYKFFYYFPRVTFKIHSYIQVIFILETFILSLITIFSPLVHPGQTGVLTSQEIYWKGPLYYLFLLHVIFYLVLTFIFIFRKIYQNHGIERKRLIIASSGVIMFATLSTIINAVLPIFDIYIFYDDGPAIYALMFVIPTFYAIVKFRFFDLGYFVLRLLRILVLVGFIALILIGVNIFLSFIFYNLPQPAIYTLTWVIGIFTLKKLEILVPELLPCNFRKFRDTITELNSKIYYCNDYQDLVGLLENTFVMRLHIKWAGLYLIREKKKMQRVNMPVYLKDAFTTELNRYKNDLLVVDEIKFQSHSQNTKAVLITAMNELEAKLCLPLFSENNLIGFLVLGPKLNNGEYNQEEIKEILSIRPNLEVAFMNILLNKNLQEESNLLKNIIENKTKKLKDQFAEIKKLLRQKSAFLAITVHEFKMPLSIATLQLENTLHDHKHSSKVLSELEETKAYLKKLNNLIKKLFETQQYDHNTVKLYKVHINLISFLSGIYNDFTPMAKERKVKLAFKNDCKNDLLLKFDGPQMRQAIYNLLDNAVKFSTKVTLKVQGASKSITIKIIDNGNGISDSDKKIIFEKFQTQKPSMGTGIGLGLYLCKKIVELHSGKIWVEDSRGGGATFCIRLSK